MRVGLITTEGFRDTLEIARGNRPDFFNLHYRKPPPFVPRRLRREVPGRMSYRGLELRARSICPASKTSSPTFGRRACRRSPSASSIPTPTRPTNAKQRRRSANCGPRSRWSPRTGSRANGGNTSGATPPCCRLMSSRWRSVIWTVFGIGSGIRGLKATSTSCSRIAASIPSMRSRGFRSPWSNPVRLRGSGEPPSSAG